MGSPLDRDDIENMSRTMNPNAVYTVAFVSVVFFWVLLTNNLL